MLSSQEGSKAHGALANCPRLLSRLLAQAAYLQNVFLDQPCRKHCIQNKVTLNLRCKLAASSNCVVALSSVAGFFFFVRLLFRLWNFK